MNEPMTAAEIARYVVAKAVWAPSIHNTQPWRFCGAALFNVRLALRSLGYTPETCVLWDASR
jgi:nitroreductase